MTEKQFIEKLSKASYSYYNTIHPELSDSQFDDLYDEFQLQYPESKYLAVVGAPVTSKKIKHKNKMISMGKAKTYEEMFAWEKKLSSITYDHKYAITYKLDGLSGKLIYVDGVITKLCTRGDGSIGQDISHLIPYMNIPKTLEDVASYFEVDGEIILPKDNGVYNLNLRNVAAGIVGRESDLSEAPLLNFVAYYIPNPIEDTVVDVYTKLSTLGFNTTGVILAKDLREVEEFFESYEKDYRTALNYETDGLVIWVNDIGLHEDIDSLWVVGHHHHYNIAWKPAAEETTTTLSNIEWNLSAQGRLIPTAIFEPITLGGSTIERATLNNLHNVVDLNLVVGDRIVVSKRNDIIPCVEENVDYNELRATEIPSFCPECGSSLQTESVHLVCQNTLCPGRSLERIIKFVEELNPDGLGKGIITKLVEENVIKSIPDLLNIKPYHMQGLEGFKKAKIDNVMVAVGEMSHMTVPQLFNALTIPLVGFKAIDKLSIKTIADFLSVTEDGSAIARNIVYWKGDDRNIELLNDILKVVTLEETADVGAKGFVVLTGKAHKGRKVLEEELKTKGYVMGKSVTKDTLFVVTDDVNGTSSKLVKARKLGTTITTYQEFFS